MVLKIAKRGTIPPFIVMDVMRAANEREAGGGDVLHLEVGQPCTDAPAPVMEAAREALGQELLGYTDAFVYLEKQIITTSSEEISFEIDSYKKKILLDGLDDIAQTLQFEDKISEFEKESKVPSVL